MMLMMLMAGALAVAGCAAAEDDTTSGDAEPAEAVPAPRITTAVPVTPAADQAAQLENADPGLAANKRLAYDFFRIILRGQQLDRAAEFMAEDYIQHNPNADTGLAGFLAYFEQFGGGPQEVPEELPGLVAIQAEDDLVTLSFVREYEEPTAPDRMYTTTWFDMFRIADGMIVEHWDTATKTEDSPLDTTAVPVTATGDPQVLLEHSDPQLAANKRLAYDFFRIILRGQQLDRAAEFMAEDYIQHNPNADTGLAGFLAYFEQFGGGPQEVPEELPGLVAIQAEDDLVTLSFVREYEEPTAPDRMYTTTWFDMFRIADGTIVEHWDPATK
jgi:predicted SnoaL-like aldol condensation-catalyzing enzyme